MLLQNPDPEKQDKPYNTQELEECDMYPDDNFLLMRLNGESHNITHMVSLVNDKSHNITHMASLENVESHNIPYDNYGKW